MNDKLLQPSMAPDLAYSVDTMPLGGSEAARQELRTVIEYGRDLVRYAVVHHSSAGRVLDAWRQGDYDIEPGRVLMFSDDPASSSRSR